MNDDELEARLRATLKDKASSITPRPDAWDGYAERPGLTAASPSHSARRMVWLGVAAAAAIVVFVVVQVTSSPSVKVTAVAPDTSDTGVSVAPSTTVETTTIPAPTTASPSGLGPVGVPVPAYFQPSSVTFVSLHTGWVLGMAPCGNTNCDELLRTRDGGQTWVALPQPPALTPPTGGLTVERRVRFANLNDGWIYGPDFWVTHDRGATWNRPSVDGMAADAWVTALETDGEVVHAVVNFSTIITSPVDRDAWTTTSVANPVGAGPVPSSELVVQGSGGWILDNNRTVIGGARLEKGHWVTWQPPCMDKAGPAVLTASTPNDVVAVCHEGVWSGPEMTENVFVSGDGGSSFREVTQPTTGDWQVDGVASAGPETIVVGGTNPDGSLVLTATFDGGQTWSGVYNAPKHGKWSDLGFTGPTQGIGIAHLEDGGELLMTTDGGHTWTPIDFYAGH